MSFGELWNVVQSLLTPDTNVPNWTVARGPLGDSFRVVSVDKKYIDIFTPNGKNIQHIPIADFESVYELWQRYIEGKIGRNEIRARTRFSKYIISILHWIETGGGK